MEWASFLCLGKLSPCFLSLHLLTIFYPLLVFSMSWNISKSSFYVKFLLVSPPLEHFHLLITTAFLLYVNKFAFTTFLWLHIFQKAAVSTCLQPVISSLFPLCLIPTSLAALSLLFLCCPFTFLGQFSLFDYSYLENVTWVYHRGTRRKQKHILCCLFLSWITRAQWPITDRLEVMTWFVTDHDEHLSLMQWFMDWRASSTVFCVLCNFSVNIFGSWNLNDIIGRLVLCKLG